MASAETKLQMNWAGCELIERVPGKVSGYSIIRGTRIMPEAIVNSYELGDSVEEIQEGFPTLSVAQINRLIEFAYKRPQEHRL